MKTSRRSFLKAAVLASAPYMLEIENNQWRQRKKMASRASADGPWPSAATKRRGE
jgi:hypothetical protein